MIVHVIDAAGWTWTVEAAQSLCFGGILLLSGLPLADVRCNGAIVTDDQMDDIPPDGAVVEVHGRRDDLAVSVSRLNLSGEPRHAPSTQHAWGMP